MSWRSAPLMIVEDQLIESARLNNFDAVNIQYLMYRQKYCGISYLLHFTDEYWQGGTIVMSLLRTNAWRKRWFNVSVQLNSYCAYMKIMCVAPLLTIRLKLIGHVNDCTMSSSCSLSTACVLSGRKSNVDISFIFKGRNRDQIISCSTYKSTLLNSREGNIQNLMELFNARRKARIPVVPPRRTPPLRFGYLRGVNSHELWWKFSNGKLP